MKSPLIIISSHISYLDVISNYKFSPPTKFLVLLIASFEADAMEAEPPGEGHCHSGAHCQLHDLQ